MEGTILIQVNNKKALKILHDMEKQDLISVVKEHVTTSTKNLSEKYRNVFSEDDAKSFDNHIKKVRSEWNTI
ncbi:MAG TPA: hypothetical protein PKE30_20635 [Niabella sp.]|nr:hypothetical protein [Niabella sp.]